ncbi:glycosyltransferase family 2 protein [Aureimonas mangrovi]|uniref:glycosyltransferase family 2 protein n=1 Tax=Aureimonas mangrovi TaxID=2758041 RepID=UPI00163DB34A|nr:glycosyltransferase family 2 protein [Aureimonas mangrovi]
MQPDVTFLVAAYDARATIARAIDSALASQGVSFEIVVADDASRDDTASVVEAIGDERVRLVRLSRNSGPGGARNAGLDEARGRYAAVLDADDTVHPDRMARLVALLEESGAAAAVDGLEVQSGSAPVAPMFTQGELDERPTLTFPDYVRANRLFAGGFNFGYLKPVFRRAFLQEHGIRYPEEIRIGEDYQFLATVLAKGGECRVEPRVGYTYHVTAGSISRVLHLHHVEAIIAGDRAFLSQHRIDAETARAYEERATSLRLAASFLTMVEALKRRDAPAALGAAIRDPAALLHFRMPIAKRLASLRPHRAAVAGPDIHPAESRETLRP